jgi:hypothetical protein
MLPKYLIAIFCACLLMSCNHRENKTPIKLSVKPKTTIYSSQSNKKLTPVFGYRFTITGDFNGDGKKEKLTEHYFSNITQQETNKFCEKLDYDSLVSLTKLKKPHSFVLCNDKKINTLEISQNPQLLGLSYLKNEGDLNGDGTDEVSYVVNWADWSNVNTWHIVTYKNDKWRDIYSFSIRDWQVPDLPRTHNQYGMMGLDKKIIITKDTSAEKKIEKRFDAFEGLVKKIAPNKIRIIYMNPEIVEDTIIVNIKQH